MPQKPSPLQIVKDKFGSKKDLVAKLAEVLEPGAGESKEELAARLGHVSNAKLLHLHGLAERVEAAGGRQGLVEKIAAVSGKAKDKDFIAQLEGRNLGELVDRLASAERQAKRAKAKKAG